MTKMTFQEADKKLAKIADGKYRDISYGLVTYPGGEQKTVVRLYIGSGINKGSGYHNTFAEAFTELFRELGILEEIPEVSA